MKLTPVVDTYPTWHPLVCNHESSDPVITPSDPCGYKGLDHTRFFAKGFITCPYGDGQDVIDSVNALPLHTIASITAEKLDVKLYRDNATPILVKCNWEKSLGMDGMIPLSIAMPLILEREVPCWCWSGLPKPGKPCVSISLAALTVRDPRCSSTKRQGKL